MKEKGLRDSAAFAAAHPVVNLVYFIIVIGMTMFTMHPAALVGSVLCAFFYHMLLAGIDSLKRDLLLVIPLTCILVVVNALTVHNGATVLFYLNGSRITLEAICYGLVMGLRLNSVLIWFFCVQVLLTEDKFLYLFGRFSPSIALVISMVFRYIPLLRHRYQEIENGQRCMGRGREQLGGIKRMKQLLKEWSILISWSLEASIETADSMEARGYGLRGRSSFHLFRWSRSDTLLLLLVVLFGGLALSGQIGGFLSVYYYPVFSMSFEKTGAAVFIGAFWGLMLIPVICDIRGEIKWRQLESKM